MNFNQILETIRHTAVANNAHDTILGALLAAIPVCIVLLIVNRLRHPNRNFLNALSIALLGFVLVPTVSVSIAVLWVQTGGAFTQALGVWIVLYIFGFWFFRRWIRSAPRAVSPAAPPPVTVPESGELTEQPM